ncbi:radical SAM family heme chaperone HemW [Mailhella sp.]|uniref:radical SAM family heme chaperone HemW n=1 Tax=Mailhella sp. TaxID=1981029 RepID=UPI0040636173
MLLYFHVPFCRAKCRYCAFYSRPLTDDALLGAWASALEADMACWARRFAQRDETPLIESIFFGGGTPSLVPPALMGRLLDRAAREFRLAPSLEVSMEANPESVTTEKARALRHAGVNRVSLGVQALDDDLLRAVGRIHTRADALAAFRSLRDSFDSVGLDFIWGLPGESLESWQTQLNEAAALRPDHLSCYGLTLEEGTPLWNERSALALPDESTQSAMYLQCGEILEEHGYRQYEISNYALPGRECSHNLGYWLGKDYLGLGPSAVSAFGPRRWTQPADLGTWLSAPREALMPEGGEMRPAPCGRTPASFGSTRPKLGDVSRLIELERLSFREQAEELVMLRLRTVRGLPLEEYRRFTGRDFAADNAQLITTLVGEGLASMDDDGTDSPRFALTRAGMLISNAVIERCFEAVPDAREEEKV